MNSIAPTSSLKIEVEKEFDFPATVIPTIFNIKEKMLYHKQK